MSLPDPLSTPVIQNKAQMSSNANKGNVIKTIIEPIVHTSHTQPPLDRVIMMLVLHATNSTVDMRGPEDAS